MRAAQRSFVTVLLCIGTGALVAPAGGQPTPGYTVVAEFPHDESAFTQGLEFRGSTLFESTGLEGQSSLRKVDLETGEVLRQRNLADRFFGEGLTSLKRKIYQLTWKSERAFIYRPWSFERIGKFAYDGEGWGLTDNGRRLIMSDGTAIIRFRRSSTFEVVREIEVTDGSEPVTNLNELEWVNGEIFANVFQTDDVVRINPQTGEVVSRINLAALRAKEVTEGSPDVTNGIAYLQSEDRLFVTGKYWAHIYEIELTEPAGLPGSR